MRKKAGHKRKIAVVHKNDFLAIEKTHDKTK